VNRLTSASGGQTPVSLDLDALQASSNFDASNRLTVNCASYDAAGNQTRLAGFGNTYDAENRLLTSTLGGVATAYTYDGDGRRVMKSSGSAATTYVYDAAGQLAAEYGAVTTPPPCVTCYLTADHLGSTRMVTDSNGTAQSLTDYLPFGEEIQSGVGGRPSPYYPPDELAVAHGGKEVVNTFIDVSNATNQAVDSLIARVTDFRFGQTQKLKASTPGEKSATLTVFALSFFIGAGEAKEATAAAISFEEARNTALKIMGETDPATGEASVGRAGALKGEITGFKPEVGNVFKQFRLDWDATKGAHINVTVGKQKYAIQFPGSLQDVRNLLKGNVQE